MTIKHPLRVAVTGASGFIGKHVLAELSRQPVETVAVTRSAAGLAEYSGDVTVVEMDLAQPSSDCFARLGRPDVLIHLAWGGLPNYRSLHHFESELPRQYDFLKKMIEEGLPSLLVTGTCFEYGLQSGPLSEDLPACPNNPYSFAKDALRRQLEFLREVHSFFLTWARIFYLYGDGQQKSSLYASLKDAAGRRDKTFRMSGGEQLRDYLPVDETAKLIVLLALNNRAAGVINVCSGKPASIRGLVEQWIEENGWDIDLDRGFYSYPDHEPMAFWGSRERLDRFLNELGDKNEG